jgi:hypothetical protein
VLDEGHRQPERRGDVAEALGRLGERRRSRRVVATDRCQPALEAGGVGALIRRRVDVTKPVVPAEQVAGGVEVAQLERSVDPGDETFDNALVRSYLSRRLEGRSPDVVRPISRSEPLRLSTMS